MENILQALYQQMRLTILLTAKDGVDKSPFSKAYLYAWNENIHPFFDDQSADWHNPYEFEIGEDTVNELFTFLSTYSEEEKPLTFYDLEKHYKVRDENSSWDRLLLIKICRYIYLSQSFTTEFWDGLLTNGQCPTEAFSIKNESLSIDFC